MVMFDDGTFGLSANPGPAFLQTTTKLHNLKRVESSLDEILVRAHRIGALVVSTWIEGSRRLVASVSAAASASARSASPGPTSSISSDSADDDDADADDHTNADENQRSPQHHLVVELQM